MTKKTSTDLVGTIEPLFAKAPALPANARDILVKIMPWIALIFGILGVLGAISGLGLLTATSPMAVLGGAEGVSAYGTGFLASIIWLISSVLMLMAYPGLKKRQYKGWNLLFYSEVVSLVGAIVSITSIVGGIIGALIGFYLLFQIKSHYK